MIDYFALALTHGILALAFLRLLGRDDLDSDAPGSMGQETGANTGGDGPAKPSGPYRSHRDTPRRNPGEQAR